MSFLQNPAGILPPPVAASGKGRISLVGAGPGAVDLMTLRAMRALGQADVIFYDRLVDPEAVDLSRPGAEKVYVGKEVGAHAWPQARIDAAIVAAALAGKHVVRLKSGDPSVFGRAAEEIAAARAHGIEIEIVPGVTAASAAAASLCRPLTERGLSDRLVLATATDCTGQTPARIADMARPGTTLVFYMAMAQLSPLCAQLAAAGVAASQPVTVVSHVSKRNERHLQTRLDRLVEDCAREGIGHPAVVMITLEKGACPGNARRAEPGQGGDASVFPGSAFPAI